MERLDNKEKRTLSVLIMMFLILAASIATIAFF
jgi:hypothetical protein